jgi:hypothetical protein
MVIQRWQSLLLFLATVLMLIFSFCSLGQIQGASQTVNILSYGIYANPQGSLMLGTIYVTVVALLAALLCLIGIFMYKNTRRQKMVCRLSLLLIVAACLSEWLAINGFELAGATEVGYSSVVFAPFVAMLAVIGAWRCIRSDERKLAAADRLR